ncbi:alkyl/aryl-sulfatase [Umboniibacter marinipuniceus]|nr:alkyl sulfatase dimerization domain-containing protein [Umboniibacter marinipuniceus]
MKIIFIWLAGCSMVVAGTAAASNESKPATEYTQFANQQVLESLPFNDKQDFEDASRGFLARPDTLTIRNEDGVVVWDLEQYKQFISLDTAAPDTVNPSLWRNTQLGMEHGLYEVREDIYQVRGFDLTNITFIAGDTGWIVFDPLISEETAAAALAFINAELGERPVKAIIYSHSHIDHYGGARGLLLNQSAEDVVVLAPEHFTEHAVSENVIAGNAMARRAIYMYGALLPRNAQGGLNGGLGMTVSTGAAGLLLPTQDIIETGESHTIDGVEMIFQMTPGSEAPAEMNTYFPEWKALWMAENTTNTMHNILTLRGALVRDPLIWATFLNETIAMWGDAVEVKFQSHHWPVWGNDRIIPYFEKQRDIYKFIHDQSVRLMNLGYTGEEISEMLRLPPELENNWATRGYYGTLRHNSRAVYQRYMGWYTGNPSDLNNLPPKYAAERYVEFMGGESETLRKAQTSFDQGDYRWVAEVGKHLVFNNPANTNAKHLLADAYEQLGYQAESGPWRSVYLQGAYELRNGVPTSGGTTTASPDTIRAMTPEMVFDYLAVRLNWEKAAGKAFKIQIELTDLDESYQLEVKNAVLNHSQNLSDDADVSLKMTTEVMNRIQLGEVTLQEAIDNGDLSVTGDQDVLINFFSMLDNFEMWFNIVTP